MNNKRFLFVIFTLLCMVFYSLIHNPKTVKGITNIDKYEIDIDGWKFVNDVQIDTDVYTALDPDTLIFRNYVNDNNHFVNLVVVYHQNDRWGAHNPQVCYNSQGWKITDKLKRISIQNNGHTVDTNRFVVKRGHLKSLVYYNWFSSNKKLTSSRNRQMFDMVLNGLIHGYTESGFLRFSITINPLNEKESVEELNDFVVKFINKFLNMQ